MYIVLFIAMVATPSSCTIESCDTAQIMQTIEDRVELPAEALPIESYSRNYARLSDHKIVAVYVEPINVQRDYEFDSSTCDSFIPTDDITKIETRPCTDDEVDVVRKLDRQLSEQFGKAGESRWFDTQAELPFMNDGGCSQVNLVFDLRLGQFEQIECNGVA